MAACPRCANGLAVNALFGSKSNGKCGICHGTGHVADWAKGQFCKNPYETCPICHGDRRCRECGGSGVIKGETDEDKNDKNEIGDREEDHDSDERYYGSTYSRHARIQEEDEEDDGWDASDEDEEDRKERIRRDWNALYYSKDQIRKRAREAYNSISTSKASSAPTSSIETPQKPKQISRLQPIAKVVQLIEDVTMGFYLSVIGIACSTGVLFIVCIPIRIIAENLSPMTRVLVALVFSIPIAMGLISYLASWFLIPLHSFIWAFSRREK